MMCSNMTPATIAFTSSVGDVDVPTIRINEEPLWFGRHMGQALGYAGDGKGLIPLIRRDWSLEFTEGVHYRMFSGSQLNNFMKLLRLGGYYTPSRMPSALVLTEAGVNLVLLKTRKPAGVQVRALFAEEIMPQIARDGSYSPDREVVDDKIVGGSLAERKYQLARAVEARRKAEAPKRLHIAGQNSLARLLTAKRLVDEATTRREAVAFAAAGDVTVAAARIVEKALDGLVGIVQQPHLDHWQGELFREFGDDQ